MPPATRTIPALFQVLHPLQASWHIHPSMPPSNKNNPSIVRSTPAARLHAQRHLQLPTRGSPFLSVTDPAPSIRTDKRPILRQEPSPGPSFKGRKRPHPPLSLRKGGPLPWDPIAHHAVVPGRHCKATPCRPSSIPMQIRRPRQHGRLTSRQEPVPKPPGMHSELLPVEVADL